ncbi:hypothetical protein RJ641_012325 [Dillenia turbinata]|uniref:DNL-type domain-containing protein n=1 Tax=Dillenia turbinata TaxID=194707 RepID=A0AAN8URH3_9MAGN
MAMAASIAFFNVFTPKFVNGEVPITSLMCPNSIFFKSKVSPIPIKFHSLRIHHGTKTMKMFKFPTISNSIDDGGELDSEWGPINSTSNGSHTGATADIKLPRRSLLVKFTCNSCGESTERLINRLAYERGTVSTVSGVAGGAGGLGGFGAGAGAWCLLCLCLLLLLCFEGAGAGEGTNTGAGAGGTMIGVGAGAGGTIDGDGAGGGVAGGGAAGAGGGVAGTGGGVAGGKVGAFCGGCGGGICGGGTIALDAGDVTGGDVDVLAGGCVAEVGVLEGGNGVGTIVGDAAGACALAIPTKARQAKKHANQSEAIPW